MRFGYTIIYVPDVEAALAFYEKAFGATRGFVAPGGVYGQLATGEVTLSFCQEDFAQKEIGTEFRRQRSGEMPAAYEIGFITEDVDAAHAQALAAGATPLAAPEHKPWGQTVAYVRDLNGVVVEICTPMAPAQPA